ncbi:2-(S)-hydroxypropyl-CoM dehydrogenase XecE [Methyloglobulus morosus KoM1]|uniref:2-(S)-hydroxypropyl-CoM dehydrogenase XecE n=1 Tax=Methyloglobulus morosus KoM1 TaxID=1116472 RepID=V5C1B0_9GAMM|nr:SDR family NAD(P)-dependent oxidoreductase [Methyloglobulus morosus]ESS72257.1 2-(S)-hydroxypropyl-CoM dehydrogenase XecE [Methyloglobulus morosus KoM1]
MMSNRFQGKQAVITGGATGMGYDIASRLGMEGASLAILDINEVALADATQALRADGVDANAYQVDISNPDEVADTFSRLIAEFNGTLDILINNAGIADFGTVETTEPEVWNKVMAVNVNSTYLCSKSALPAMKHRGGAIINFGSVAGMVGIPNMAAYCASKAAVIGLTKQMAVDYSKLGIRVNCICPGMIADTDMGRQILATDGSEEMMNKRLSKYPIGRFGKSEEIVAAVLFLASDEASFVCGSAFTVDGAMTAL